MSIKFTVVALGLGISLGVFSNQAFSQSQSDVIAEIGGQKVTTQDLEHKEAGKLLQAKYKYFVSEREALQQYIDDELLEMQAKKEGVTVEELLKRHVASTIGEPTEDQLRFYFEGVQTDDTYDAARPHIIDTIHQLRTKKAREAYITQLRGDYGVVVELSQPSAQVEIGDSPRIGSDKAPVQIVEFADYECPYCQQVNGDLAKLRGQFGDQVSLVFKDYPLPMHSLAPKAAEAGRCAGTQGKFWEYHDSLFETKRVQKSDLKEQASTLKLDTARFNQCLDNGEQAAGVRKDVLEGQRLGLTGTPSFFINGHFMSGAISYSKLREVVVEELSKKGPGQRAALAPSKTNAK